MNEFDNNTLSTFGYRHFLSDENGSYNISICPKEPLNEPQRYYIMAKNLDNNKILINETKSLSEGENISVDLIFSGVSPEKPNKPFGRKIVDAAYDAMMRAIARDQLPHFLLLSYDNTNATVKDLLIIPKVLLSYSPK